MKNLSNILKESLINNKNGVFFNQFEYISYKDLYSKVKAFQIIIRQNKIKNLGILADNSIEWIIADLAALFENITVTPLPLFFSKEQIQHIIQDSNIDYIFNGHDLEKTNIQSIEHSFFKITYTSGTTGNPKGVCLSQDNILTTMYALLKIMNIKINSHINILPYSTLLENICGIYLPIIEDSFIYCFSLSKLGFLGSSKIDINIFNTTLQNLYHKDNKTAPESCIFVPELLRLAYFSSKHNNMNYLHNMKFISVGGGAVNKNLLLLLQQENIKIFQGYGLSECCSVVALNSEKSNCIGSVGKPLDHVKVDIIDDEIVITGNIMLGYLKQNKEEKIFTGDLGYFENGYLYIKGRKKNVIVNGFGRNISPEWIEEHFKQLPYVKLCLLSGSEEIKLHLYVELIHPQYNDKFKEDFILLNKRLPDYAQSEEFSFYDLESLLLPSGKINRRAL